MAVVAINSQSIQDIDAQRVKFLNPLKSHARIRENAETVTTNDDDSIGSVYRFVRIPSRARVSEILIATDGEGTGGAGDVGLYHANGGVAVDADLFAAALAMATANNALSATPALDPADFTKPLWEVLGLSEDPGVEYDVAITFTSAVNAVRELSMRVRYVLAE